MCRLDPAREAAVAQAPSHSKADNLWTLPIVSVRSTNSCRLAFLFAVGCPPLPREFLLSAHRLYPILAREC